MKYRWVDYSSSIVWEGKNFRDFRNVSRDGGKSWSPNEYKDILFGAYFFLSDDYVANYH